MRRNNGWKLVAGALALTLTAAACGGDDGDSTSTEPSVSEAPAGSEAPADGECAEVTSVKLQLQWFIQAQFAG
ncbi:MAG: ABC transporter substrate-binding protein, partial [Actinomycetota bacterium]